MARRSGFKRNKRRNKRRLTQAQVSRALNPSSNYQYERRLDVMSTTQNYVRWGVLIPSMNAYTSIPTPETIVTQAGHEATGLVTTDPNYSVRIYKQSIVYNIRNLSNHAAFLDLYELLCIKSINAPASGAVDQAQEAVVQTLFEGWDVLMPAAYADAAGTGSQIIYTAGNNYLETPMGCLHLGYNKMFKEHFKICKKQSYKLAPGDDVKFSMGAPHKDWSGADIFANAGAAIVEPRPLVEKGKSKFVMFRLRGALGKDTVDDTKIGYMTTDLGYECLYRCKLYRLGTSERRLGTSTVNVDAAIGTLEGPTDMTHAVENL